MQTETLYGFHPVYEALKAGRRNFVEIYIAQNKASKRFDNIKLMADRLKIPVKKIKPAQLRLMAGTDSHQGIGAKAGLYPFTEISHIIGRITSNHGKDHNKGNNHPFLLVLDNIVDPNNLGAIIRTALCVGINGIIIPANRSALPTPSVSKASAGALEHIHISRVVNLVNTIKILKKNGFWIAGMDKTADKSIFASDLTGPIAIIIGGEEKGIHALVKKHCDFLISIPQTGQINSLNASVAGAVVMYEVFRQRRTASP